jgi:molecular chaperone GrpE (heat shock protein)
MTNDPQELAPLLTANGSSTIEENQSTDAMPYGTSAPESDSHAHNPTVDSPIIAEPGTWSSTEHDQVSSSERLAVILNELANLRRDFEAKVVYDTGQQRQLDVLHEELESYRRGFHLQLLRPMITDLITLYSDMDKVAARLVTQETHADAAREIAQFRDQVEEILRRNGVERYTSPSEEFDGSRQRAIAAVETNDPANDKRVAERLRPGFEYEGRVIVQAEQVKTYRFVPPITGE